MLTFIIALSIVLTVISCKTVEPIQQLDIPQYSVPLPERPVLDTTTDGAEPVAIIRVLTTSISRLVAYVEKLELHMAGERAYYRGIAGILSR